LFDQFLLSQLAKHSFNDICQTVNHRILLIS